MVAANPLPPLEELKEVFSVTDQYPSGLLWKINPSKQGGKKAGSMAGSAPIKRCPYWRVKYKQKHYLCHRIRWSLMNNRLVLPQECIDHVELNTFDNRCELRIASHSENNYNKKTAQTTSGYKWVVATNRNLKCPWRVMMRINKKLEFFGYFEDPVEAAKHADSIAREKLDLRYIRLNFPS